jgi:DNA ligase-associated metallophosphoesterase
LILDLPPGPVRLLPDKSVFLVNSRTLVLGDTHFGKSAAFRARGLPVPEGDTAADLARINALIATETPDEVIIAGDLLHARVGCAPEVLDQLIPWLQAAPATVTLVEGNHDQSCGRQPLGAEFPLLPEVTRNGFHILHNPDEVLTVEDGFHIGGHLHPTVRIKDGTGPGFRAPVFWLRGNQLVLPAFGSFTGGQLYSFDKNHHRLFTPLNKRVVELPGKLWDLK